MVEVKKDKVSDRWVVTRCDYGCGPECSLYTDEELEEMTGKYMASFYDKANSVGLGEILLFGGALRLFVESETRRSRIVNAVVGFCGYETPAREFVRQVSYQDFRKVNGIGEVSAEALRLYLMFICGIDWPHPYRKLNFQR